MRKGGKETAAGEDWIAVRIPVDAKRWLAEWAQRRDRSMSYLVRRLVIQAHERDEQFSDDERLPRPGREEEA